MNENFISPENLNRPNVHTEIERVALSSNRGSDSSSKLQWIATVERRDDGVTTAEVRLKFWCFDTVDKK